MVKKWMVNSVVVLGSLWLVYVFLHWTQLRVWQRWHPPIFMKFRYTLQESTPDAQTTSINSLSTVKSLHYDASHKSSLDSLPQFSKHQYDPKSKTCSPKNLGPVTTPTTVADLTQEMLTRSQPLRAGLWRPADCAPSQRFAIIIPYRNRSENLRLVTHHLNFFLQQQQAEYGIFVVEQADKRLFNRAKLFNVAITMLGRMYPHITCFVFHDADKLPMNSQHIYRCGKRPMHLINRMRSSTSKKFYRGMLYHNFFGGVTSLTKDMFYKINGMSNNYWGWGREDDDLSARLRLKGLAPEYVHHASAIYVNIAHKNDVIVNKNPWPHMGVVRNAMAKDGISSVNFTIRAVERHPFYTLISVYL